MEESQDQRTEALRQLAMLMGQREYYTSTHTGGRIHEPLAGDGPEWSLVSIHPKPTSSFGEMIILWARPKTSRL